VEVALQGLVPRYVRQLEVHALLGTAELVHPGDAMVVLGLELMVGSQAQQENKGM
jgi:hypothetical protein